MDLPESFLEALPCVIVFTMRRESAQPRLKMYGFDDFAELWFGPAIPGIGGSGGPIFSEADVAEYLRSSVIRAGLAYARDQGRCVQRFNGIGLLHSAWCRAQWPDKPIAVSRELPPNLGRRQLEAWSACVHRCPKPELPAGMWSILSDPELTDDLVWSSRIGSRCQLRTLAPGLPGPLEFLVNEVTHNLGYLPLHRLLASAPEACKAAPNGDQEQFMAELSCGPLRVGHGLYAGIEFALEDNGFAVRATIEVPEHLAETPMPDVFAWWPCARAGIRVPLSASYELLPNGIEPKLEFRNWDSMLALHPLVSSRTDNQGARVVCIADSAERLVQQMIARGITDVGTMLCEVLLCLRDGVMYGYHRDLDNNVYNPYPVGPDGHVPEFRSVTRREAQRMVERRGIEIVPWNR